MSCSLRCARRRKVSTTTAALVARDRGDEPFELLGARGDGRARDLAARVGQPQTHRAAVTRVALALQPVLVLGLGDEPRDGALLQPQPLRKLVLRKQRLAVELKERMRLGDRDRLAARRALGLMKAESPDKANKRTLELVRVVSERD